MEQENNNREVGDVRGKGWVGGLGRQEWWHRMMCVVCEFVDVLCVCLFLKDTEDEDDDDVVVFYSCWFVW